MHCPQCGQQQVSNELRFCSRCGFPLGGVTELVANGGILPQYQAPPVATERPKASPRRKGVQQGAALVFLAAVLTPLFAVLNEYVGFPELFIALSAVIGFIGGTLRIIYALIFEEGAQKVVYLNPNVQQPLFTPYQQPASQPRPLNDANRARQLPPQSATPPAQSWRRPNTAELINKPPSVTENTTKLLDKQEKEEPQ
ncbi:MAG TPA: hypothetical protein VJS44_21410 [Pyrinomonadaceae bacterium]|nr:hypothetical protein [Pyrinomonadaceae bacterium]